MFKNRNKNIDRLIEGFANKVASRILSEESEKERMERLEKRVKDRLERERQADLDRQQLRPYNSRQAMLSRAPEVKSKYVHQKPELERVKKDRLQREDALNRQKKEEINILNTIDKVLKDTLNLINAEVPPSETIKLKTRDRDVEYAPQGGRLVSTYKSDFTVEEKAVDFVDKVDLLLRNYRTDQETLSREIDEIKTKLADLESRPKAKKTTEEIKKLNTLINRKLEKINIIGKRVEIVTKQVNNVIDKLEYLEVVRESIATLKRQIGNL